MAQAAQRGGEAAEAAREGRPAPAQAQEEGRAGEGVALNGASDLEIGPLRGSERAEAAALLARAFLESPLDRAVVGGGEARRLRIGRAAMRASVDGAFGRDDLRAARRAGRLAGVLLALAPYAHPRPPPPIGVQLRAVLRQGLRVAQRWREVACALEARHPSGPHHYLSLLGVEPELQGRGVGSALLSSWLRDVGSEVAWLETAREINVVFYRRFGFDVSDEIRLLDVPIWLMARPAGAAV